MRWLFEWLVAIVVTLVIVVFTFVFWDLVGNDPSLERLGLGVAVGVMAYVVRQNIFGSRP